MPWAFDLDIDYSTAPAGKRAHGASLAPKTLAPWKLEETAIQP
jgi:hypothetical protein